MTIGHDPFERFDLDTVLFRLYLFGLLYFFFFFFTSSSPAL